MCLRSLIAHLLARQKTLSNISYYFVASMIGAAIQLLVTPFLALYLEADDFAITGYFYSFNSLLLPLISFSLVSYYSRSYFRLNAREREKLKNTLVISLLFIASMFSIISLGGLNWFFKFKNVSIPFFPYALLCISSMFFSVFFTFALVNLKLERNAKKYLKVNVWQAAIAGIMAVAIVIGMKWGAFGKMFAATATALIFSIYALRRLLTKWEFDKHYLLAAIKFSWPLSLAAMLSYFFSGVDRVFLESLNDTQMLGLFNIAAQIAGYLALFSAALNNTFQPDILESIAKKNNKRTGTILGGIMLLNLIPIAIFILFAPFLINVLTFGQFADAAGLARVLSLKNITSGLYFGLSTVLVGYGYTRFTLISKSVGMVLVLFMFKFLIGRFGFFGAAWGQVFSFLILSIFALAFIFYTERKSQVLKPTV